MTIRCNNKLQFFETLFGLHQDFHTSTHLTHIYATRGFAILVEWLCVLYIGAITTIVMMTDSNVTLRAYSIIVSNRFNRFERLIYWIVIVVFLVASGRYFVDC